MEGFGGEWNVFVNENENEVVLTSVGRKVPGKWWRKSQEQSWRE